MTFTAVPASLLVRDRQSDLRQLLAGEALPMRNVSLFAAVVLTSGLLGCTPTQRTVSGAAVGGAAGVVGGAFLAGPIGAVAGGATGAATGAALAAPSREEQLR